MPLGPYNLAPSESRRNPIAFTLIELLATIAVIFILAAIILPLFQNMRYMADRTTGVMNLRAIGSAIHLYVQDNDGHLPGPLKTGQQSTYNIGDEQRLGNRLWQYLDGKEPTNVWQTLPALTTPLHTRFSRKSGGPVYAVNRYLPDSEAAVRTEIWGYANSNTSNPGSPLRMSDFGNHGNIWALQELDSLHPAADGTGWQNDIPPAPLHRNSRMTLYFDWRVDFQPAD